MSHVRSMPIEAHAHKKAAAGHFQAFFVESLIANFVDAQKVGS